MAVAALVLAGRTLVRTLAAELLVALAGGRL
jgi:hypothetical protein